MPDRRGAVVPTLLLVLVGLGLFAAGWLLHPGKPPEVPAVTQARLDRLAQDSTRFRAFQDSARTVVTAFRDSTAQLSIRVAALQWSASSAGHRADSLAALAQQVDTIPDDASARYWAAAYQERSREADSLRIATSLSLTALRQAQNFANLCLVAQKDSDGRMSQLNQVVGDLRAVIAKSRVPSRLGLAVFGGYGATLSGGRVQTGPLVGVGVAYSLRLPHLF